MSNLSDFLPPNVASTVSFSPSSGIASTNVQDAIVEVVTDAALQYAPISNPTFGGTVTGSFSGPIAGNVTGNTSGNTVSTKHLIGTSAAPTAAVNGGAGTGASVSIIGTDLGFKITLTSGTLPTAAATILTVTFNGSYSSAPHCQFSPSNANAAQLSGTSSVYCTATTTTFVLNAGTVALGASTLYVWEVIAVQ
jgi:hypothetical protein